MVWSLSNVLKVCSFIIAGALSLLVATFSCVQLVRVNGLDKDLYIAMLSSVFSLWLPSPLTGINAVSGIITEVPEQKEQIKSVEIV